MFDKNRLKYLLSNIEDSINLILSQRATIKCSLDFVSSQHGVFVMGGICMQLVLIGEYVKVIDAKTDGKYLLNYPEIPWKAIMGLRNLIAHEYNKIDEDEIFNIINDDLDALLRTVQQMKRELE